MTLGLFFTLFAVNFFIALLFIILPAIFCLSLENPELLKIKSKKTFNIYFGLFYILILVLGYFVVNLLKNYP